MLDPRSPVGFGEQAGQSIDEASLPTEALVALYRLGAPLVDDAIRSCAARSSPLTFQRAVIRAVSDLWTAEVAWTPSKQQLLDSFSEPIRQIFHELRSQVLAGPPASAPRRSSDRRPSQVEPPNREVAVDLLSSLLRLWHEKPQVALHRGKSSWSDLAFLFTPGLGLFNAQVPPPIQILALETEFEVIHYLKQTDLSDADPSLLFARVADLPVTLCAMALDARSGADSVHALGLLSRMQRLAVKQLHDEAEPPVWASPPERWLSAHVATDIAILISLTSPDAEVRARALDALRSFAPIVGRPEYRRPMEGTWILAAAEDDEQPLDNDRSAQSRWLLRILRSLTRPTPSLIAAWDELIRRWHQRLPQTRLTDPEQQTAAIDEWINLTSILLAISHVILLDPNMPGLAAVDRSRALQPRFYQEQDRYESAVGVLREMLTPAIAAEPRMREAVRVHLADVAPELLPELFSHLRSIITNL